MKKHFLYIDNLKGIAILLVVLGHCIQELVPNYDDNVFFKAIYSFHMPLFFIISGYLTYRKEYVFSTVIKKRAYQLLLPYFIWGGVNLICDNHGIMSLFTNIGSNLWFLWTLFFIILLTLCVDIVLKENKIKLISFILLSIALLVIGKISPNILGIKHICVQFRWFLLGFFASKYNLNRYLNQKYMILLFIAWMLMLPLWHRNTIQIGTHTLNSIETLLFHTMSSFFACYAVWSLFILHMDRKSFLRYFGSASLGIYTIHLYLVLLIHQTTITTFILAAPLSLLIVELIRKSKYLKPLIGEGI